MAWAKISKIRSDGTWSSKSDFRCSCQETTDKSGQILNIILKNEQTFEITCRNGKKHEYPVSYFF